MLSSSNTPTCLLGLNISLFLIPVGLFTPFCRGRFKHFFMHSMQILAILAMTKCQLQCSQAIDSYIYTQNFSYSVPTDTYYWPPHFASYKCRRNSGIPTNLSRPEHGHSGLPFSSQPLCLCQQIIPSTIKSLFTTLVLRGLYNIPSSSYGAGCASDFLKEWILKEPKLSMQFVCATFSTRHYKSTLQIPRPIGGSIRICYLFHSCHNQQYREDIT
jgi:hypothetical protein